MPRLSYCGRACSARVGAKGLERLIGDSGLSTIERESAATAGSMRSAERDTVVGAEMVPRPQRVHHRLANNTYSGIKIPIWGTIW